MCKKLTSTPTAMGWSARPQPRFKSFGRPSQHQLMVSAWDVQQSYMSVMLRCPHIFCQLGDKSPGSKLFLFDRETRSGSCFVGAHNGLFLPPPEPLRIMPVSPMHIAFSLESYWHTSVSIYLLAGLWIMWKRNLWFPLPLTFLKLSLSLTSAEADAFFFSDMFPTHYLYHCCDHSLLPTFVFIKGRMDKIEVWANSWAACHGRKQ